MALSGHGGVRNQDVLLVMYPGKAWEALHLAFSPEDLNDEMSLYMLA